MPAAARLSDLLDDLRKQAVGTELEGLVEEVYATAVELIDANVTAAQLLTRGALSVLGVTAGGQAPASARLRPVDDADPDGEGLAAELEELRAARITLAQLLTRAVLPALGGAGSGAPGASTPVPRSARLRPVAPAVASSIP